MAKVKSWRIVSSSGTSHTGILPPGINAGDMIIFFIATGGANPSPTTPTGYTPLTTGGSSQTNRSSLDGFYKIATASETNPVTTSSSTVAQLGVIVIESDGAGTLALNAEAGEDLFGSNGEQSISSFNTTADDCLLIYGFGTDQSCVATSRDGSLIPIDGTADGTAGFSFARSFQATLGAVGTKNVFRDDNTYAIKLAISDTAATRQPYVVSGVDWHTAYQQTTSQISTLNATTAVDETSANLDFDFIARTGRPVFARLEIFTGFSTGNYAIGDLTLFPIDASTNPLILIPSLTSVANGDSAGSIANDGVIVGFYSDRGGINEAWRAWTVSGSNDLYFAQGGDGSVIVDVSDTASMVDSSGTFDATDIDGMFFAVLHNTAAAADHEWIISSELVHLKPHVFVGGDATTPINNAAIGDWLSKPDAGFGALQGQSQAFSSTDIQVGDGTSPTYADLSQGSLEIQSPSTASNDVRYNTNNAGASFYYYPNSTGTILHRNAIIKSLTPFAWGLHASAPSSATYNFTGLQVVGPGVKYLRNIGQNYAGLTLSGFDSVVFGTGFGSTWGMTGGNTFDSCVGPQAVHITSKAEFEALQSCDFTNNSALAIKITGDQNNAAGVWSAAGMTVSNGGGSFDIEYTGTTDFTIEFDVGSGFSQGRVNNSSTGTLTVSVPTQALRINPDVTITGAIRYFDGTPDDITPNDSGTGDFLDYTYTTTDPIDIEVVEQGYVPVNQQDITPFNGTLNIEMDFDEAYNASHGLTITTHYTYNRATKAFAILADQNAFDVRSSMADTIRTNSSYYNTPLLLEAKPGGKRIDLIDGATITSMATWKGAGMERYDALGTIYPIEKWYAIQSVQDITGASVIYRQTNSGDFTIGALTGGKFDETLQFYSDTTVPPDNNPETNNDSYLLIKALRVGYRQARNDVVAGNGGASLKSDLYTIGLAPTAHDYAGGPIDLSATMTLVAGGTVGGKTFAYKWVDGGTNSGTDIADWINYMGATSPNGLIPGSTGLRWAEMPDMVIYVTGGVETAQGYREGATPTLVGFYMERGGSDHPDMVRAQADDGTYYVPATLAGIQATNLTAGWAELYNVTTATLVESVAVTSGYSKTWTNGTDFTAGDTGRLRWRGEGSLPIQIDFIATTDTTVTALDTPETDESYDAFVSVHGVTGASITEFALDGSNVQFDITDPDNIWYAARMYIWYSYAMVSANGIANFWGAADSPDPTRIRIRSSVVDAYLDNTKAVSARQGDQIIVARDDGVYPQAIPTSGGGGIGMYFTGVGFTSSSGSGLTTEQAAMLSAVNNKTGQLTFTVAGQVDSNCESMNGHALQGDGSESDKIRTINAP